MRKYQVLQLDVWKEEGSFVVNDFFNIGAVEIGDEFTDEQIIQCLFENGYLSAYGKKVARVLNTGCDGYIEIVKGETERPLLHLREVN